MEAARLSNTQSNSSAASPLPTDTKLWQPLRHFNYYRLTLALALFFFFSAELLENFLGKNDPVGFLITSTAFALSSLIYIFFSHIQKPSFNNQVILANSSDIVFITLMMHFSGGLISGLGMLLIVNIVATGTFLRSRESYFFAALASIAILTEQTYETLQGSVTSNAYSAAGILGMVFFASSMLSSILNRRLRESEALANKKAADLVNLEKLNEHIIQNMRTGILVLSSDGHIRMANNSAETLLGHISLKNQPLLSDIFTPLDQRFLEWQSQPQIHQKPIRQQKGLPDIQPGFRKLDDSTANAGDTLVFLEDAIQLNQRFQQIKLASLGRLTASIAHEIRNPLSGINHAAQLLRESNIDAADEKLTQIILTQVQRLDKIVENVLQLSRQEPEQTESILLSEWIENFRTEFCSSQQINPDQIKTDISPKNTRILFEPSHLYQVICNLCTNAISHADKHIDKVKIVLTGGYNKRMDQPFLDVLDNGPGIPSELVSQIFDPFFTTSSKGTGLGLFISKEIVESNRAKIQHVETNQDGNCFRIFFLSAPQTTS